ncbi:MAG: alpha/beta fold hydrolase [Acidimicrobiales bacterium]
MTPDRFQRHTVQTNGIELSYLEAGDGPVVILAHGFPETSHSWRHQLTYLADHGYRALALDLRGYGGSSKPNEISSYSILHLSGDLVALAESLEIQTACVVGHDWGAPVAWHCALFRPDLFVGVVGLSVPYRSQRAHAAPTSIMTASLGGQENESFYMVYFQEPGLAEAEFELDVDRSIRCFLYGETPSIRQTGWQRLVTENGRLLSSVRRPHFHHGFEKRTSLTTLRRSPKEDFEVRSTSTAISTTTGSSRARSTTIQSPYLPSTSSANTI